jgi:hypothetical protein
MLPIRGKVDYTPAKASASPVVDSGSAAKQATAPAVEPPSPCELKDKLRTISRRIRSDLQQLKQQATLACASGMTIVADHCEDVATNTAASLHRLSRKLDHST